MSRMRAPRGSATVPVCSRRPYWSLSDSPSARDTSRHVIPADRLSKLQVRWTSRVITVTPTAGSVVGGAPLPMDAGAHPGLASTAMARSNPRRLSRSTTRISRRSLAPSSLSPCVTETAGSLVGSEALQSMVCFVVPCLGGGAQGSRDRVGVLPN